VSTKKTSFPGPEGFRYFLIFSLVLHGALLWAVFSLGPRMGWFKVSEPRKPRYVQIVELPPGYRVPDTGLRPPKKPRRYADRTNVVEKEEIPSGQAIRLRPLPGTMAKGKSARGTSKRASKRASSPSKAKKKVAGVAKPRRVFKTKEGATKGGAKSTPASQTKKTLLAKGSKSARETKEEKSLASEQAGNDAISIKSARKKGENRGKDEKTLKAETTTPRKKGPEKAAGRTARHPGAGSRGASATKQAVRSRPNLMLSDTKVSELARKYHGSGPRSKSKTLMLNTSELKYQKYLIDLRHKIEQYWEYPRAAVMRGWEGKLFIDFTIKRDGTISDIRLARSSRYPVLDDAAITALKLAAPFATFPKNFEVNEIKVHGQFVYTLIGMPQY
jgi:protein TonB